MLLVDFNTFFFFLVLGLELEDKGTARTSLLLQFPLLAVHCIVAEIPASPQHLAPVSVPITSGSRKEGELCFLVPTGLCRHTQPNCF